MGIVDTPPPACAEYVLKVESNLALLILILNIIFPGLGTLITAFIAGEFNVKVLLVAIAQALLTCILIGWIWSILHGVWVYNKSK